MEINLLLFPRYMIDSSYMTYVYDRQSVALDFAIQHAVSGIRAVSGERSIYEVIICTYPPIQENV